MTDENNDTISVDKLLKKIKKLFDLYPEEDKVARFRFKRKLWDFMEDLETDVNHSVKWANMRTEESEPVPYDDPAEWVQRDIDLEKGE